MTYWIASGTRQNWEIGMKYSVWGIPKHNRALYSKVYVDDTILMFAGSEMYNLQYHHPEILGYGKVSELFEDENPLFIPSSNKKDETFPNRFKLKEITIFYPPLALSPLIPELGFIKNKTVWAGHFKQNMRMIPWNDYKIIVTAGESCGTTD